MNKIIERHFWRCSRCLTIMATEGERDTMQGLLCACGSRCNGMGRVERGRLVMSGVRCACDARCTNARGPKCECDCGGSNHGSGRVVPYKFDMGGVPSVTMDVSIALEKAKEFESTVESLRDEIRERYPELAAKRRGEWIPSWDRFLDGVDLLEGIHRSKRLKSHAGRMKALTSLRLYMAKLTERGPA